MGSPPALVQANWFSFALPVLGSGKTPRRSLSGHSCWRYPHPYPKTILGYMVHSSQAAGRQQREFRRPPNDVLFCFLTQTIHTNLTTVKWNADLKAIQWIITIKHIKNTTFSVLFQGPINTVLVWLKWSFNITKLDVGRTVWEGILIHFFSLFLLKSASYSSHQQRVWTERLATDVAFQAEQPCLIVEQPFDICQAHTGGRLTCQHSYCQLQVSASIYCPP